MVDAKTCTKIWNPSGGDCLEANCNQVCASFGPNGTGKCLDFSRCECTFDC